MRIVEPEYFYDDAYNKIWDMVGTYITAKKYECTFRGMDSLLIVHTFRKVTRVKWNDASNT